EQWKEVRRDCVSRDAFRFTITSEVEAGLTTGGHVDKRLVLSFPVDVICRRGRVVRKAREREVFPNDHELFRLLKRQRPQQNCIDYTKDRRIRADAERERDESDNRKPRPL